MFLEHVTAWFEHADTGWIGDRPDLDLDRYFHQSADRRLYLYDDLGQYLNRSVRSAPGQQQHDADPARRPFPKVLKHSKDRFGYVTDLGEVDVPREPGQTPARLARPRTWTAEFASSRSRSSC